MSWGNTLSHSSNQLRLAGILTLIFVFLIVAFFYSRPSAERRPSEATAQITVDLMLLQAQDLPVVIQSYGLAKPLTQTSLVARVGGVVNFVDENFREGGSFKKGQLLIALEKDDYLIELDIAKAQVAEAQSRLQNEQALAEEAKYDWQRSGRKGEAPALALRQPQLRAAEAALISADAAVKRAELNLQRTDIKAPFDGRVISHNVGEAQVVGVNTALAEVFSTQAAEIKLPIKSKDYQFLDLPLTDDKPAPNVVFTSQFGKTRHWEGSIVRASGAIDEASRQLYVVARIDDPFYAQDSSLRPLKVGEYLTADIQGLTLKNVLVIPNSAIYQGSYVYVYKDGQVHRRNITFSWSDASRALVASGLSAGEQLVITPLGRVTSGTLVKIAGSENTEKKDNKKSGSVGQEAKRGVSP